MGTERLGRTSAHAAKRSERTKSFGRLKASRVANETLPDGAILAGLLVFRVVNGLVLKSSFNPDEHWQSSEVAHHLVFGYGFLTWEWEPCIALRSVVHPALFAAVYWLLARVGLDSPSLVALAPRVLQSIIAAFTDYGTYRLAKAWYPLSRGPEGRRCDNADTSSRATPYSLAYFALICSVFSWFNFFCIPRTYSNCLEAALNVWSLLFFAEVSAAAYTHALIASSAEAPRSPSVTPRQPNGADKFSRSAVSTGEVQQSAPHRVYAHDLRGRALPESKMRFRHRSRIAWALVLAAISVLVRPTAAIFWSVFCLCKLAQLSSIGTPENMRRDPAERQRLTLLKPASFFRLCVVIGVAAVTFGAVCDSLFYGFVTFPPWNFVKFNLFSDPGRFYGSQPWHYFLLEAPGVVLLSFYPVLAVGVTVWWAALAATLGKPPARKAASGEASARPICCVPFTRLAQGFILRDDGATILATAFSLVSLSLATHKEYRFMVPFLPPLLIFTGIGLGRIVVGRDVILRQLVVSPLHQETPRQSPAKPHRASGWLKFSLGAIFAVQGVAAIICSFFHQMGASGIVGRLQAVPETATVFFLTSCHELPFYSHVHRRIRMGFLDCSPRVDDDMLPMNWQQRFWRGTKEERVAFLDALFPVHPQESAVVSPSLPPSDAYSNVEIASDPWTNSWFGNAKTRQVMAPQNPAKCLDYRFSVPLEARRAPTHLVVPSVLVADLAEWLAQRGYEEAGDPVFDAVFAETPAGDVRWQYLHVFENRT
ncbi:putative mannosyltransferase [Besnoitia besnoiti]|uniref:Mannosyltransferase n=1 Tax=Besnoitia besnoiti TaxID=94643 RepID=A0A2A9M8B5_BESBE|nr:putative mannosyltransferase [Besnoitia besnoiti]PFH31923.1 putative mannosyltransferase [Besnoitia besnoiti]